MPRKKTPTLRSFEQDKEDIDRTANALLDAVDALRLWMEKTSYGDRLQQGQTLAVNLVVATIATTAEAFGVEDRNSPRVTAMLEAIAASSAERRAGDKALKEFV